eukprot:9859362-Alexandrium_andersonii.AAC.1
MGTTARASADEHGQAQASPQFRQAPHAHRHMQLAWQSFTAVCSGVALSPLRCTPQPRNHIPTHKALPGRVGGALG